MCQYRFYVIKTDGHIDGPAMDLELPDDLAAVTEARKLTNGRDIEIWQAERLVAYIVPDERGGGWQAALEERPKVKSV